MSKSATLTIRINPLIKEAAKIRANPLGVNLGVLVENDLRRFINGYPITIDDDSFVPTESLLNDIKLARANEAKGKYDDIDAKNVKSYLDNLIESE